jgi:hypothetical protein
MAPTEGLFVILEENCSQIFRASRCPARRATRSLQQGDRVSRIGRRKLFSGSGFITAARAPARNFSSCAHVAKSSGRRTMPSSAVCSAGHAVLGKHDPPARNCRSVVRYFCPRRRAILARPHQVAGEVGRALFVARQQILPSRGDENGFCVRSPTIGLWSRAHSSPKAPMFT